MNVLKNNYNHCNEDDISMANSYPRNIICEQCESELEYDKSDVRIGALGCAFIDCPLCGYDNMLLDSEMAINLTAHNITFPKHFWHTSEEDGAVDCCNNEEVKKCIYKAIDYFRKNKDEFSWHTMYGNLYIHVRRYDGDEVYSVVVSKDYYNTDIRFEAEDYE